MFLLYIYVWNYIYIYNKYSNISEIIFNLDILELVDYYQNQINNTLLIDKYKDAT